MKMSVPAVIHDMIWCKETPRAEHTQWRSSRAQNSQRQCVRWRKIVKIWHIFTFPRTRVPSSWDGKGKMRVKGRKKRTLSPCFCFIWFFWQNQPRSIFYDGFFLSTLSLKRAHCGERWCQPSRSTGSLVHWRLLVCSVSRFAGTEISWWTIVELHRRQAIVISFHNLASDQSKTMSLGFAWWIK